VQQQSLDIHRARFGLAMILASLFGVGVAGAVGAFQGGSQAAGLAAMSVAMGLAAGFIPVARAIPADYWGVGVVACGMGRNLIILAGAYMLVPDDAPKRAAFIGACVGAVVILTIESAMAVYLIGDLDRRKQHLKHSGGDSTPAGTEHA
jgi:uncharacterized BrkB/YihY/UPF0761 family membrane protein